MTTTASRIPFNDLTGQYRSIRNEILSAIETELERGTYILGPSVETFESEFARSHQAPYCVAVNSGTAALHLVMMALALGPGDEVILPANTFFASAEAVSLAGATPVFVDCLAETCNVDPVAAEAAITPRTKAILAVHLYGQPAAMGQLQAITEKRGLFLIEDCAQAHLATYQGQPVGSFGIAGCFSFYPGKNLGAYGEGGAVITQDPNLYQKLVMLRNHGSREKYHHDLVGHNYRMEGLQGAILKVKLQYLSEWTRNRQRVADWYNTRLRMLHPSPVRLLEILPEVEAVHHLYVIRVNERDALARHLANQGIETGIHYPIPCHLQKAYAALGYRQGDLPVSEQVACELLSLPIYPEMTEAQVAMVCETIFSFYTPQGSIM